MTEPCREFERRLTSREAGSALEAGDEAALRFHLAECGSCRESALRRDPALLFGILGTGGRDELYWARVWRDIQPGLDEIDRERAERPRLGFRIARTAAACAAVAAATVLTVVALRSGPPPDPGVAENDAHLARSGEPAREYRYEEDGTTVVFIVDEDIDL